MRSDPEANDEPYNLYVAAKYLVRAANHPFAAVAPAGGAATPRCLRVDRFTGLCEHSPLSHIPFEFLDTSSDNH